MFLGMNSKKQGDVGLGAAIGYFATCGYTVSIPLTDSQEYDLVVDIDGKLCKVQVKTTRQLNKNGSFNVCLSTQGGNQSWNGTVKCFDNTLVDFLFVLCGDTTRYMIPAEEVPGKRTITVGLKYRQFQV